MADASMADKLKALLLSAGAQPAEGSVLSSMVKPSDMPFGTGSTPQQPPVQDVSDDPVQTPAPQPQAAPAPQVLKRLPAAGGGGMSKQAADMKALQDELRDRLTQSQEAQQEGVDFDKAKLAGELQVKNPVNLQGGMNLVAMLNPGSTQAQAAAKNYQAPTSNDAAVDTARKQQASSQQALTKDQTDELHAQLQAKLMNQSMVAQRQSLMQDRLNENVYGGVVKRLYNDPILSEAIKNNNSINRTVDGMFADGQSISMSSLHDLQQTVTNALTSAKGGGGIGEREQRTINTMQNSLQSLAQRFGDLDSVPKDDPTLVHFLQLAQTGQGLITDQAKQRMKALASGHENITSLPTYAPMLEGVKTEIANSLQPAKYYQSHNTLKPGSDTASAGSLSQQDQAAIAWAKANASDPRAQKILDMHGVK